MLGFCWSLDFFGSVRWCQLSLARSSLVFGWCRLVMSLKSWSRSIPLFVYFFGGPLFDWFLSICENQSDALFSCFSVPAQQWHTVTKQKFVLFEQWISKVCKKLVSDWSISFLQRSSMSSNQRGILQSYFTQDSIHTMILYSNRWVSFFTPYNFKDNTNLAVSSESNNEHLKKPSAANMEKKGVSRYESTVFIDHQNSRVHLELLNTFRTTCNTFSSVSQDMIF